MPEELAHPNIREGSWLNEPRFAWFRVGYAYACTQRYAAGGISKVPPEELYYVVLAFMRSQGYDPQIEADRTY